MRWFIVIWFCLASPSFAQESAVAARVIPTESSVTDAGEGVTLTLALTGTVPYRVFTLDAPRRLLVDFEGLDWAETAAAALDHSDAIIALRFGTFRPGWSRLVLDLATPLSVATAGMAVGDGATLTITLAPVPPAVFSRDAGAPPDGTWAQIANAAPDLPAPTPVDGPVTVVIDPGHGGIDPGAVQGEVQEADLMLALAEELASQLTQTGRIRVILTRTSDAFVSLERRMSMARAARADLMISLHADALDVDEAQGAAIYTLSARGVDRAAARMAERHERGDMLAGLDLTGQGDRVATALMDMTRAETGPQSTRFAETAIEALRNTGVRLNASPLRAGQFAVLNAPDFAAVLIETGFLSNPRDRAALATADGRAAIVTGLADAVQIWAQEEAVRATRLRQ